MAYRDLISLETVLRQGMSLGVFTRQDVVRAIIEEGISEFAAAMLVADWMENPLKMNMTPCPC